MACKNESKFILALKMFKYFSTLRHRMFKNNFFNCDIFDKDSHNCETPKMHSRFILNMCLI